MPSFSCERCGASFSLPERVLERFPGWTPRTCRACRDQASPATTAGGGGGAPPDGRPGGSGGASGGRRGGGARGGQRGGGARGGQRGGGARGGPREENLPVAEVLRRYQGGPQDGVFTDGSAHPNPGRGGWGAVYVVGGEVVDQAWGHEEQTTNNRMELVALIEGVELVPRGTPATVYTDSRLAHDTVTKWAAGWQRRGWKRKTGPIANLDLVQRLYQRFGERPELRLEWIAAHAGNRWNEYADALSTAWMRDEV